MASREYIGSGGLRLTLDDPLSPQMAKQVANGHLRPVKGEDPVVEASNKALVVGHGSEADTVNRVGTHRRSPGERPGEDAHPGQWATYAVALGLNADQASTMSVTQIQQWVAAQEPQGSQEELPADDGQDGDGETLERPAKNAPVADWRAYAVARGMDDAESATKADCQDYVQVLDDAEQAGE